MDPIAIADRIATTDRIVSAGRIASGAVAGALLVVVAVPLPAVAVAAAIDQNSNWAEKPGDGMNGSPFV